MTKPNSSNYKRKVQQQKRQQKQFNRNLSIGVIIIVLIALVIAAWPEPEPEPLPVSRLGSDPALGVEGAPIVIIEYGDFGCPTCRVWHQAGIRDQILEEYRDQVQFVWRDYPVITAQSVAQSRGSRSMRFRPGQILGIPRLHLRADEFTEC